MALYQKQFQLTRSINVAPTRSKTKTSRGRGQIVLNSFQNGGQGCRFVGIGSSVPELVLTNADLEKLVDTNDEWITTRTGIKQRHVLGEGESLSLHASVASQKALDMAGLNASDLDLVLMATSSPDDLFGSACEVSGIIGAHSAAAFDITAACSGFVISLVTAAQFIRTGAYQNILVIGADALSRYIDWTDRKTCILFGDGCGAMILQSSPDIQSCGLLAMDINSDGKGQQHLHSKFSPNQPKPQNGYSSKQAEFCNMYMNGQEVFKFALRSVPETLQRSLQNANLTSDQIDWLVLHQANQRIITAVAQRFEIPMEKVVSNIQSYGNTSAASIPLAFDEVVRGGQVKEGDVVAIAGFGAGLTWCSALFKWR